MGKSLEEVVKANELMKQRRYEEIEKNNKFIIENLKNITRNAKGKDLIFLYGKTGSGKSYLLKKYVFTKKDLRVKLIEQINLKIIEDLIEECNLYDVLILEHIQFLVGKERMQEETKKIIEQLIEKDKKVILTSDRKIQQYSDILGELVERGICLEMK